METTERIVESWSRHDKKWLAISTIKAKNNEIDLLAIDAKTGKNFINQCR